MVCKSNQSLTVQTKLKVNGKEVELNNFAQNFISQTVIGMVKSLRGVGHIETINLNVSKEVK
jgi:hypothetical protein